MIRSLITYTPILLITLVLMMYQPASQIQHMQIDQFNRTVQSYTQRAKQEGYFTPTIIDDLKDDLSFIFKSDKSDIYVDATNTRKYRTETYNPNELIRYRIGVPIKVYFPGANFFFIEDEDLKGHKIIEGHTTSERELEP